MFTGCGRDCRALRPAADAAFWSVSSSLYASVDSGNCEKQSVNSVYQSIKPGVVQIFKRRSILHLGSLL
jgi:hypothetical protein